MKPDAELASDGRQRGFWCLFVTQFQGAFSDNAVKWLAIFVITGLGLSNEKRDQLVGIVGALFALPFIALSMTGGFLADRFSKCSVTIGVKVFEIFVMLLALAGLATNQFYLTLSCVFLMGVHSAISDLPNTGCCRSCSRRENYRGATASSNSAPFSPSSEEQSPAGGCAKRTPIPASTTSAIAGMIPIFNDGQIETHWENRVLRKWATGQRMFWGTGEVGHAW